MHNPNDRHDSAPVNIPLTEWAPGLTHFVGDACATPPNGIGTGSPLCGDCSARGPAKNWIRADQISASRLTAGSQVNVDLRGVLPRDAQGRFLHVVGIRLVGTYRYVTAGSNASFTGYQQLAAWQNIVLEDVSGWEYLSNVDARDLLDDRYLRTGVQSTFVDTVPATINANVGAQNNDVDVSIYFPLTRPYAKGADAMDGSIPLALIQARGDAAFRFTAAGSPAGAPTGITCGGFQGTTEVWLEVVALPTMVLAQPWQVRTYNDVNTQGNAQNCDRATDYLTVRPYPEDNGGQYCNDFGIATFQAAGNTIASGLTLAQQQERTIMALSDDPRVTDSVPSILSGGYSRFLFLVPPTRSRSAMVAGTISYQWTSRTRTSTRFLHRTVAGHIQARLDAARAYGGGDVVGMGADGSIVAPHKEATAVIAPAAMNGKK